jgi:O-antigen ligase
MLQILAGLVTIVYSFTYFRIPEDVFGNALPLQFLFGVSSFVAIVFSFLFNEKVRMSERARSYLSTASLFLSYLLCDLVFRWVVSQGDFLSGYFDLSLFAIDFLKYVSCFSSGFVVYLALRRSPGSLLLLQKTLLASGILAICTSFVLLALYYLGYQSGNSFLARSYLDAYVGVWPSNGLDSLPRLSGGSIEPQQFSVVFLTPLLLMISPRYIRSLWPFALLGIIALVISQSKFIIASFSLIILYLLIVYKPWRRFISISVISFSPPFLYFLSQLPVFSQTLEDGAESVAFTERQDNLGFLVYQIFENFWHGVGAGQYATSVNDLLHFDLLKRNYIPNLDYLKIFAETGVIGFLLTIYLLWRVVRGAVADKKNISPEDREQHLAFLIGTFGLLLNMFFAYQYLQNLFWINIGFLMFYSGDQFNTLSKTGVDSIGASMQMETLPSQE